MTEDISGPFETAHLPDKSQHRFRYSLCDSHLLGRRGWSCVRGRVEGFQLCVGPVQAKLLEKKMPCGPPSIDEAKLVVSDHGLLLDLKTLSISSSLSMTHLTMAILHNLTNRIMDERALLLIFLVFPCSLAIEYVQC